MTARRATRRWIAPLSAGLALALCAGAAQARPTMPAVAAGAQVVLHAPAPLAPGAGEAIVADAEAALAQYTAWGFPAPLSDGARGGDARLDIYLGDTGGAVGRARYDTRLLVSPGYVELRPSLVRAREIYRRGIVAHEMFHLVQYAMAARAAPFLKEATADMMQHRLGPPTRPAVPFALAAPEVPLDCPRTNCPPGGAKSYRHWLFFEHLVRRHGMPVIAELFREIARRTGAGLPDHPFHALGPVLKRHGSSLKEEWRTFALSVLSPESYGFAWLAGTEPAAVAAVTSSTGAAHLGRQYTTLDHLSSRYIRYGVAEGATCGPTTLTIAVRAPQSPRLQVLFRRQTATGATEQSAPVRKGIARLSVPWSTCPDVRGTLVVVNPTINLDAQRVRVDSFITG